MNSKKKDHGLLASNAKSTFSAKFVSDCALHLCLSAIHTTNLDFKHERRHQKKPISLQNQKGSVTVRVIQTFSETIFQQLK